MNKNYKSKIFEDKTFIVNAPYNSVKELFNTERFKVKIFRENGDDEYFVIMREKKEESKELEEEKILPLA